MNRAYREINNFSPVDYAEKLRSLHKLNLAKSAATDHGLSTDEIDVRIEQVSNDLLGSTFGLSIGDILVSTSRSGRSCRTKISEIAIPPSGPTDNHNQGVIISGQHVKVDGKEGEGEDVVLISFEPFVKSKKEAPKRFVDWVDPHKEYEKMLKDAWPRERIISTWIQCLKRLGATPRDLVCHLPIMRDVEKPFTWNGWLKRENVEDYYINIQVSEIEEPLPRGFYRDYPDAGFKQTARYLSQNPDNDEWIAAVVLAAVIFSNLTGPRNRSAFLDLGLDVTLNLFHIRCEVADIGGGNRLHWHSSCTEVIPGFRVSSLQASDMGELLGQFAEAFILFVKKNAFYIARVSNSQGPCG